MKADVVIVGAGFAGASTAYHLSQKFEGTVLLLEAEDRPGVHASGLNASMVIQAAQSPAIRKLFAESRRFYETHSLAVGFDQTGSLLLGRAEDLENLRDPDLFVSEIKSQEEIQRQLPVLEGHEFEAGIWTASDGVMDIRRLMHFYLTEARKRGVMVQCRTRVETISADRDFELTTTAGKVTSPVVVNAAGAWSRSLAATLPAQCFELRAFKRHLFVLQSSVTLDADCPPVWNLEHDFYFRPWSGGTLFCVCDSEFSPDLDARLDPEIQQQVAEVLWQHFPALRDAVQKDSWCCFRSFSPDGLAMIGPDPALSGFYWATALGGFGMSSSFAMGKLAAQSILEGTAPQADFDPARFHSR